MRIGIIWNFWGAKNIFDNWHDGHRAAIEYVGKKHKISWFLADDYKNAQDTFDFLLFWNDCSDPIIDYFSQFKARKGLILTSDNNLNPDNLKKYNVIYCESEPVKEKVEIYGVRTIKAMGTDSDFFSPDDSKKDIEYFYPATFSPWKRQSKIAHLGPKLLCVGTIQPDGQEELKVCQDKDVNIEIGYFPAKKIRDYYRRAKQIWIPAIHGSERTVLEAMSCGILPIVISDNSKALSYINECFSVGKENNPRQFILDNYSHKIFGKQLLKGIENG